MILIVINYLMLNLINEIIVRIDCDIYKTVFGVRFESK